MLLFWKLLGAIIITVMLALIGSVLLGEWALVLVFTESIRDYTYLLVPTVGCCGIIALIWFLGTILTILRDMKGLIMGAAAGVAAVSAVSYPCIAAWGIDGVNTALFLSSGITVIVFAVSFWKYMKKW